ncbi:MAG: DUF4340 domain-containing protein, partial [Myxococcota bacterium]
MSLQRQRAIGLGLALVAAGVLFALIVRQDTEQRRVESVEQAEARVFTSKPSAVIAVKLQNGEQIFEIERSDGEWRIQSPRELPADSEVVGGMVRFVAALERLKDVGEEREGEVIPPDDLALFELSPPRFQIELVTVEGRTVLDVGKKNNFDGNAYAKLASAPGVFVVDGGVHFHLDKTELDLRDKRLVPLSASAITRFESSGSVATPWRFEALRVGEDFETVPDTEAPQLLSSAATKELLRRVTTTGATLILSESLDPEALAKLGLAAPDARWRFSGGGQSVEVAIRETENPTRYLAASSALGIVELVSPVLHRRLTQNPEALLDRRLFPVGQEQVRRVEIRSDEERVVMEPADGEWSVNGEPGGDGTRIGALLYNLLRLERAGTPRGPPPDPWPPGVTVVVHGGGKTHEYELILSASGISWGRKTSGG